MDYAHDGYLYIASPYTHDDPMIRQRRYEKALDFTAWLAMTYRMWGFSPIVHAHNMDLQGNPKFNHDFWMDWGRCMLRGATGLVVLQIDGWGVSKGIDLEMVYARELGKPMYLSQNLWGKVYDHTL